MLKKLSRFAIAAAFSAVTLAFHVGDASSQAKNVGDRDANSRQDRVDRGFANRRDRSTAKARYYDCFYGGHYSSSRSRCMEGAYGYRADRHGYYRNGYWYDSPVGFVAAPITLPLAVATAPFRAISGEPAFGSRRHVEWCSAHHRSYNPSANTWVSYGGVVHTCVSPYR